MGIYVGFDPGGVNAFGWAVLSGSSFPFKLQDSGVADHAQGAIRAARGCAGDRIDGLGIDAPLFWNPAGDRNADQVVRNAIRNLGSHSATVGSVNSLQGACVVQGMLVALLAQKELCVPISITESHPKALLWLLGFATRNRRPDAVSLDDLQEYLLRDGQLRLAEHERDAALGAFAAFAAVSKMDGWRDLYLLETNPVTPLNPPPEYWMPI